MNNWALLYKYEEGKPKHFFDIKLFDTTLWIKSGEVKTWGSSETINCKNTEDAWSKFRSEINQMISNGFISTFAGIYDPCQFDFDKLTDEIYEGAKKAFSAIHLAHSDENINAFAVSTDSSFMTIGICANSLEAIRDNGEEDQEDLFWNPDEWPYFEGDEYLDIAYRRILTQHQDPPPKFKFKKFRAGFIESSILALKRLDNEGFFGEGKQREETFILFHVSDDDYIMDAIKRLNTPDIYSRFQKWWKSWN